MTHPQATVDALISILSLCYDCQDGLGHSLEGDANTILDMIAPLLTAPLQAELCAANVSLARAAEALNAVEAYLELIRSARPDGGSIRNIVRAALAEIEGMK